MPNIQLYPGKKDHAIIYEDMFFSATPLTRSNPALAKAERDFIKQKWDLPYPYSQIKVLIEYADGTVIRQPVKPPTARTLV